MNDTTAQEPRSKLLMHFTMSLDGFVAGPNHTMGWMTGTARPGLVEEYVQTTGAVIGGRDGWDVVQHARPYGGAWQGPIFILTHHPADAAPAAAVTFLNCDVGQAAQMALEAAEGKNVEVLSSIGQQPSSNEASSTRSTSISHPSCSGRGSDSSTIQPGSRSIWTCSTARSPPRSSISLRARRRGRQVTVWCLTERKVWPRTARNSPVASHPGARRTVRYHVGRTRSGSDNFSSTMSALTCSAMSPRTSRMRSIPSMPRSDGSSVSQT